MNLKKFFQKIGILEKDIIDDVNKLIDFIHSQSAYVMQISLYEYIKTRAGTQYPTLFENEIYLKSMKIARWHIYSGCLSDILIYLLYLICENNHENFRTKKNNIILIFNKITKSNNQDDVSVEKISKILKNFSSKINDLKIKELMNNNYLFFQHSSEMFVKWAPVAEEFKRLDKEIMINSISFRWIGVRRELNKRVDFSQISKDLEKPFIFEKQES
jgi:hypothetical protein